MPALLSGKYTDRVAVYSSYISTFVDRDIKELSGSINSLKFMSFITAVAALAGQLLNFRTIADHADILGGNGQELAQNPRNAGHHLLSTPLFQQCAQAHDQNTKTIFLRLWSGLLPHSLERS